MSIAACWRCTISPPACRCCRAEIEKERGVVIEEWRGRLGAGSRLTDKQLPVLLRRVALRRAAADRHAGDSQDAFRASGSLDFYRQWYRPDQMAVVVVGDIDPARGAAAGARSVSAPIPAVNGAGRDRRSRRAAAQGDAVQRRDRSRSAGLDRVAGVQAPGRSRAHGRRLSALADPAARDADAESAAARDRAAAERAVPRRRRPAGRASAARSSSSSSAPTVPGRRHRRRASKRSSLEARRMQQFGFSREELDRAQGGAARVLRARLQGARHSGEPELRRASTCARSSSRSRFPASSSNTRSRRPFCRRSRSPR